VAGEDPRVQVRYSVSVRRLLLLLALLVVAGPLPAGGPIGLNVHTAGPALMTMAQDSGVGWVRIDFIWSLVETENDRLDWSMYDRLIGDAEARGLRVFATIAATPAWATDGTPGPGRPRDLGDWWDFCYRAAARYRDRVDAWGLWNEPNLDRFWEGSQNDYVVRILGIGARAVRAADPSAMVCGPELAHLGSGDWDGWLRESVSRSLQLLDVVTHHLYPDGFSAGSVVDKLEDGSSLPWADPSVREVLDDSGWIDRAVWLTETGARSGDNDELDQSEFYANLLNHYFPQHGEAGWLDGLFFYELVDDPRFPDENFGVIGPAPELNPKPAFTVLQTVTEGNPVFDGFLGPAPTATLLAPGTNHTVVVEVENTGEWPWLEGSRPTVLVEEAPADWEFSVGGVTTDVGPGERGFVEIGVAPPPTEIGAGNQWIEVRLRLVDPTGRRFGTPRRVQLVGGWDPLPVIRRHPVDLVADEGADARFSIEVEPRDGQSVDWYRNGRRLLDPDATFDGRTATLVVAQATWADAAEYRAAVETDAGTVLSDRVTLRLAGDPDLVPREADGRAGGETITAPRFEDVFPEVPRQEAPVAEIGDDGRG
jgi:hypothetical protein